MKEIVKQINDSTNIIAVILILIALLYVATGQSQIAEKLVIGALSFAGGGAVHKLAEASKDETEMKG